MATNSPTYSDLLQDFDRSQVNSDVIRSVNEAAVKNSVRNLVMTNKGERFFKPLCGCGIRRYLFEPQTPQTALDIRNAITEVLSNYEPRITKLSVGVTTDFANAAYNISIIFSVVNISNPLQVTLQLNQLR